MFSLGGMIVIPGLSLAPTTTAYAQNLDIPFIDEEEEATNTQTIEQSIEQEIEQEVDQSEENEQDNDILRLKLELLTKILLKD